MPTNEKFTQIKKKTSEKWGNFHSGHQALRRFPLSPPPPPRKMTVLTLQIEHVFGFLDGCGCRVSMLVCKGWYAKVNQAKIWEKVCMCMTMTMTVTATMTATATTMMTTTTLR